LSFCARLLLLTWMAVQLLAGDAAEAPDGVPEDVLEKYIEVTQAQRDHLRGVKMDIDISAELPKLKKKGRLWGLRTITRLGQITYDALRFEGDNTVKKEVIARYLAAESDVDPKKAPPITPQFYKFRYKGLVERVGKTVYMFQLTPKKKLAGTFKGELWLDKDTCLPLRESGRLSKNPSVFIKRFEFVRTYAIEDGLSIPKQTLGTVETRLWGKAEVQIDFSNFEKVDAEPAAHSSTGNGVLARHP